MKIFQFCFVVGLLLLSQLLAAQVTNVWKGGTPGRETDWHCPKNWSKGDVPDEFTDVVIADVSSTTRRYPVIAHGQIEVASLLIRSGAALTVRPGASLWLEQWDNAGQCNGCTEGIVLMDVDSQRLALDTVPQNQSPFR